jgi:hypothetical protein
MLGGLRRISGTLSLHRTELLVHVVNRSEGLLAKEKKELPSVVTLRAENSFSECPKKTSEQIEV